MREGKRDGRGIIISPQLYMRIGYSIDDKFHGHYVYFGQARGKRVGTYNFDKKHDKEV